MLIRKTRAWLSSLAMALALVAGLHAENPLKHPHTSKDFEATPQVRSLSSLMQIVFELEKSVAGKDLSSIHNEDTILGLTMKALTTRLDIVPYTVRDKFHADLAVFAQSVSALHLAGDLNQQAKAESELARVEESFGKVRAYFPSWTVAAASKSTNVFMCPMHRDVQGARTNLCPKCGMELDQLVRVMPPDAGINAADQAIHASIRTEKPLVTGQRASAILRLTKSNGEPVYFTDLIETHTKRIHLLIIDPSLTDYHHEHPQPTKTPGEYSFSFTPRKPGSYRAFADLRPNPLGLQEYDLAEITAETSPEPFTNRTLNTETVVDGLRYELILPGTPIHTGVPTSAKLRVLNKDGQPFTQLEPIMAAFAHIVAFNEDYKTVLHMHPRGGAVLDPKARGGPELEFQIYSLTPGFYRLFAQVQIHGESHFAPFGLRILP